MLIHKVFLKAVSRFSFYRIFVLFFIVLLPGCTQKGSGGNALLTLSLPSSAPGGDAAKVLSSTNSKGSDLHASAADLTKTCFAINVTGDGLSGLPNSCGYLPGVFSQMVLGGGQVSIEVKKGAGRKIELVRYTLGSGETACPKWDPSNCSLAVNCRVLKSGATEGVNIIGDEMAVDITLDLINSSPISQSLVCGSGQLKLALSSDGRVLNSSGSVLSPDATNEKAHSISAADNAVETWNSSGLSTGGLIVPPYVRSITRKPDSGKLFGLVGTNDIVALDGAGSTSNLVSCPFVTCSVPPFIESISAGFGSALFGIDSSGAVYKVTPTGVEKIQDLGPTLVHAVYN